MAAIKRFSELTIAGQAIEVLRWFCLLPAAYLSSRLPYLFFWLLIPLPMAQPPGTPQPPPSSYLQRMLLSLVAALLVSLHFVLAGSLVAPRRRGYVAIVLALLATLHAVLYHIVIHLPGTPHYTSFAAALLAAFASAALVFYLDRRRPAPSSA